MLFSINFYSLAMTLGFIAGRVLKPFCGLNTYDELSFLMVMFSLPLVIYQMCFSVDIHNWYGKKSVMLTLVVLPGWFVSIPITVFFTKSVLGTTIAWDFQTYLLFTICCSMNQLQKVYEGIIPLSVNIRWLLQIEQLVAFIPANMALTLALEGVSCHTILAPVLAWQLLWNLLALLIGIVIREVVECLLKSYLVDAKAFAMLLLFVICPTFYYGQTYFGSGILFSFFALMSCTPNKLYCTREVRACSNFCCELLIVVVRTMTFVSSGFLVGNDPEFVNPTTVIGSFTIYIASVIGRGCLHILIKLVIHNSGSPYPRNGFPTIICGLCASELALLCSVLYRYYDNFYGQQVLTCISFVTLFSSIVSGIISLFLGGFYDRKDFQNKSIPKTLLENCFNKFRGSCIYDIVKIHALLSEITQPANVIADTETVMDASGCDKAYLASLRKIYNIESIYHWKEWKKGKISYWCLAGLRILTEKKIRENDYSMRLYHIKCALFDPHSEKFLKVVINYILGKIYELEEDRFSSGEWRIQYMLEVESTLPCKLLVAFTVFLEIALLTMIIYYRFRPSGLPSTILFIEVLYMFLFCFSLTKLVTTYFWKGLLLIAKYFLGQLTVQHFEIGKLYITANRNNINMLHYVEMNPTIYNKVFSDLEREECLLHAWLKFIEVRKPCLDYTLNTRINTRIMQIFFTKYTNHALDLGNLNLLGQHTIFKSLNYKGMFFSKPGVCLEGLLYGIAWINSNANMISIISKACRFVLFSPNQKIITSGEFPAGMYIIVNGSASCCYVPNKCTINNFVKYGLLPNCDYLDSISTNDAKMTYIPSGKVIGEIGAVTGRSYDMDVICETAVHVVYIPHKCVTQVLWRNEASNEMRANIWKCIAINISKLLFRHLPQYKSWSSDDSYSYLSKGTVFEMKSSVQVDFTESVADVILIEGRVVDESTMNVFYAPYYLPKMARRFVLPENKTSFAKGRSCPPQFFFIPTELLHRSPEIGAGLSQFIISPPRAVETKLSFETYGKKSPKIQYRVKDFEITMKIGDVYESPIGLLIKETVVKKTASSDKEEKSFMSTTDIWLTEPEVKDEITKNAMRFIG
nr:uncharacterized protein LOC106678084 [Halyomorpha halys]